jgi:hypothetical protein
MVGKSSVKYENIMAGFGSGIQSIGNYMEMNVLLEFWFQVNIK